MTQPTQTYTGNTRTEETREVAGGEHILLPKEHVTRLVKETTECLSALEEMTGESFQGEPIMESLFLIAQQLHD